MSFFDVESDKAARKRKSRRLQKRKKLFFHSNNGFVDRTLRLLTKSWLLLIAILAMMMLAFEAYKLGWRSIEEAKLDRHDPITRAVKVCGKARLDAGDGLEAYPNLYVV